MPKTFCFSHTFPDTHKESIIVPIEIAFSVSEPDIPTDKKIAVKLNALIDTGATNSCISERYAKSCNLFATQYVTMRSVNAIQAVPLYSVDVILTDEIIFKNIRVLQIDGESDFDFIIGMDILSKGRLLIDSTRKETIFEFSVPSDFFIENELER